MPNNQYNELMYQVGSPNRKVRISPTAIIKLDNGQNLVWPSSKPGRYWKSTKTDFLWICPFGGKSWSLIILVVQKLNGARIYEKIIPMLPLLNELITDIKPDF